MFENFVINFLSVDMVNEISNECWDVIDAVYWMRRRTLLITLTIKHRLQQLTVTVADRTKSMKCIVVVVNRRPTKK